MFGDDPDRERFSDTVRSIAREIGESIERLAEQVDVDEAAGYIGVDSERAREWVESTARWLGVQLEQFGEEVAARTEGAGFAAAQQRSHAAEDPLRGAGPHPLDLPTEEQGVALAALDSGRWKVEPGSNRLVGQGDGTPPSDALGLVGELRARDWISADGALTLAGRNALGRWLAASQGR
jgi:hypothetical protein